MKLRSQSVTVFHFLFLIDTARVIVYPRSVRQGVTDLFLFPGDISEYVIVMLLKGNVRVKNLLEQVSHAPKRW